MKLNNSLYTLKVITQRRGNLLKEGIESYHKAVISKEVISHNCFNRPNSQQILLAFIKALHKNER